MRFLFCFILFIPLFLQGDSDTLYSVSHSPGFYDSKINLVIKSETGDMFYNTGEK